MVPYVDVVVAVTVMCVVLYVCMLKECEGDGNAGVRDGGGVVNASAGHVGGTGIVPSVYDVLEMSVYVFGSGRRGRRVGESIGFVLYQSMDMVFKEYSSPVSTPLVKHVFSTIEIYITDSAGRPVPFSSGKV